MYRESWSVGVFGTLGCQNNTIFFVDRHQFSVVKLLSAFYQFISTIQTYSYSLYTVRCNLLEEKEEEEKKLVIYHNFFPLCTIVYYWLCKWVSLVGWLSCYKISMHYINGIKYTLYAFIDRMCLFALYFSIWSIFWINFEMRGKRIRNLMTKTLSTSWHYPKMYQLTTAHCEWLYECIPNITSSFRKNLARERGRER